MKLPRATRIIKCPYCNMEFSANDIAHQLSLHMELHRDLNEVDVRDKIVGITSASVEATTGAP